MQKMWKRIAAVALSLSLLLGAAPMEAFAAAGERFAAFFDSAAGETASTASAAADFSPADETSTASPGAAEATILREVESLREEKVKHFEMSDGSLRAVSYETAVHYRKAGEWLDLDNRLQADKADGVAGYANAGNDLQIKLAARSDEAYLLQLQREGYRLRFRALSGGRTDDAAEASPAQSAAAEKGSAPANPAEANDAAPATGTNDAASAAGGGKTAEGGAAAPASGEGKSSGRTQSSGLKIYDQQAQRYLPAEEAAPEAPAAAEAPASPASPENPATPASAGNPASYGSRDEPAYNPDFSLKYAASAAVYEEIFDRVHLEYLLQGDTLKENIVLTGRLEGYAFDFAVSAPGMTLRLLEDGSVAAFAAEDAASRPGVETAAAGSALDESDGSAPDENADSAAASGAIFVIPAPFMYDAGGESSAAVHYELTGGEEDCWRLRTVADAAWINDEERVFPVVIDPAIRTEQNESSIRSSYVSSAYPTRAMNQTVWMEVGRYHDGQNVTTSRGLIDITLPTLEPGCVPVAGSLNLCYTTSFSDTSARREVDLYELTSAYNSGTATWNAQPSAAGQAVDYHILQNTGENNYTWGAFDITALLQKWYLDPGSKKGLLLKAKEESVTASQYFAAKFLRGRLSAYVSGLTRDYFPFFTVDYRNTNGAEDYWTTTSIEAGRSGSASVNHFSGNFMMVQPICGASGNILPVSISMIYNSGNEIGAGGITTASDSGIGWRTNYNVAVYTSGIEHYMYYFVDADGTKHYFYSAESGAFHTGKDEDGLGYSFTRYDSPQYDGADAYTYRIEDKDGGAMLFNSAGNLVKIKDTNGHSIRVEYESLSAPAKQRIRRVLDGVGRAYTFGYTDSANAARITGITDPAGRTTSLSYAGDLLWKMTFPDGRYIEFAYGSGSEATPMSCIDRHDGTMVSLSCHADSRRVSTLRYGTAGADNLRYSFTYRPNETDITDLSGRTVTYRFNGYGQTTGILDRTSGMATCYEQGAPGLSPGKNSVNPTANKTTKVSNVQQSSVNLVRSSGFDSSAISTAYTVEDSGTGGSLGWSSKGRTGTGSAQITRSSAAQSGYTYYTQDLGTPGGGEYTFTGYVHTAGATLGGSGAVLRLESWNGTTVTGGISSAKILSTGADEWKKVSVSIRLPAGQRLKALFGFEDGATSGTAYFDDLQVEAGAASDARNMLPNSGFSGDSAYWSATFGGSFSQVGEEDGLPGGGRAFYLPGAAGADRRVYSNYIYVSGKKGDVYAFGGWAKGFSAATNGRSRLELGSSSTDYRPGFSVQLEFYNGTTRVGEPVTADFNALSNAWQFVGAEAIAPAAYTRVRYFLTYSRNINGAYFAKPYLYKENYGASYTYDDKGNVVSAVDAAEARSSFAYDRSNQLSQLTSPTGSSYLYTYEEGTRNLTSATSSAGQTYSFEYANGNATGATVTGKGFAASITTNSASDGTGQYYYLRNKLSGNALDGGSGRSGAAVRNWAFTGGESQKWRLLSAGGTDLYYLIPAAGNATASDANNYRLGVSGGGTANDAAVVLSASSGTAQKIKLQKMPDGSYVLLTGSSGYAKCVDGQPGSRTDTANGTPVYQYAYDENDAGQRWYLLPADLSGELYMTTSAAYSPNGNYMTELTDAAGNQTTFEYAETKGLLTKRTAPNQSTTSYSYDASDRVTGVSRENSVNSYTYDASDRLKTITSGRSGGLVRYTFGYDAFGRNTGVTVGNGSTAQTLVTNSFDSRNLLTGVRYGSGSTASYTYDALDRLSQTVYNDVNGSYSYSYTRQGRLCSVEDTVGNFKTVYSYDLAGRLAESTQTRLTSGLDWISSRYEYDETNRLTGYSRTLRILGSTSLSATFGDITKGEDPGKVYALTSNGTRRLEYGYDSLGRLQNTTLHNDYTDFYTLYTYHNTRDGGTTGQVKTIEYRGTNGVRNNDTLTYYYNVNGQIVSETDSSGKGKTYTYDSLGRLYREDDAKAGTTTAYNYDDRGNIAQKRVYAYTTGILANGTLRDTITYTYGNTVWKDLLTAYDGESITYDGVGNPLSYRGGMSFTWQAGRQMKTATVGNLTYTMQYNQDGVRTGKVQSAGSTTGEETVYYI